MVSQSKIKKLICTLILVCASSQVLGFDRDIYPNDNRKYYRPGSMATLKHNLLSVTHGDTTPATAVKGDIIYALTNGDWRDLPIGDNNDILGITAGLPGWQAQTFRDHGGLSGLSDDDHTIYLLADGTRDLTGDWVIAANSITLTAGKLSAANLDVEGYGYFGSLFIDATTGPLAHEFLNHDDDLYIINNHDAKSIVFKLGTSIEDVLTLTEGTPDLISIPDSTRLTFGAGGDLILYSDGTNGVLFADSSLRVGAGTINYTAFSPAGGISQVGAATASFNATTVTSLTDGVATLTGGSLTDAVDISCTGDLSVGGDATIEGAFEVTTGGETVATLTSTNHTNAYLDFMRTGNAYTDWRVGNGGGEYQWRTSADDGANWSTRLKLTSLGNLVFSDNREVRFGDNPDRFATLQWENHQVPETFVIGLNDDADSTHSRSMIICGDLDVAFNFAHPAQLNPTLFVHSDNQATDEWISFTHNQTNGVIEIGKGVLDLPATNIGDGTNDTRISATGNVVLPAGAIGVGRAPLKFTDGTALTTPETGALEFHDNRLYMTNKSVRKALDRTSDVKLTTTTVDGDAGAQGTTETEVYSASVPAGSWVAGNFLKMFMAGDLTNKVGAAGHTITMRVYVGLDEVATILSTAAKFTNACWHIKGFATVRSVGGSGSMAWHVDMTIEGDNSTDSCAVETIDTTGALDITVTAQWGTADAANIFTCTMGLMEYKN